MNNLCTIVCDDKIRTLTLCNFHLKRARETIKKQDPNGAIIVVAETEESCKYCDFELPPTM